MTSRIAVIEVYPDYDEEDGSVDLTLNFSYGCPELGLMGYTNVRDLVHDIRKELKRRRKEDEI